MSIKFSLKSWKNASEMYEMIESPYGEDAMNRPLIFKYFWKIQVGKKSTENDGRSSNPCSRRNEKNVQHGQSLMIPYHPLCLLQSTKVHRLLKRKLHQKPEMLTMKIGASCKTKQRLTIPFLWSSFRIDDRLCVSEILRIHHISRPWTMFYFPRSN